ncbi:MAG: metallophosphoesterase family protein [Mariniphaga sp.]
MKNQCHSVICYLTFILLIHLFIPELSSGQTNLPTNLPDRIILNPTAQPLNSVAVTWRTDTTIFKGFCELQPATANRIKPEDSRIIKAKTTHVRYVYDNEPTIYVLQNSAVLDSLKPGMKYIYRVGSGKSWSEWFTFKVPGGVSEKFSFLYFGDPQVSLSSDWPRVVRQAYRQNPDCQFMLYAGDIINKAGHDTEWDDWFKAGSYLFATVPQVLTPGNHDYNKLEIDPHWKAQFSQPTNGPDGLKGTCFFIDYPNLRLISIDSAADSELEHEDGNAMNSQKAWLDSVLRINTKNWVIVTTHLPFYSTKASRDNDLLRKHFQPILEKYKIDLVLTGHDHSYGRGRASDNPQIVPSVVYVVSVSGSKLYPVENKPWMEFKGENIQLFQQITVGQNTLDYKSFAADGSLYDDFRLVRMKDGRKKFYE